VLTYRVFPHVAGVRATQPGHARYLPEQGAGRFDNPASYRARYLALDPTTAVIERFAGLAWWSAAMFRVPGLAGAMYRLGVLEVDEGIDVVDLDDPRRLVDLGSRPTEVMSADRSVTQELARRIHERGADGVRWWSTWPEHRPLLALWSTDVRVVRVLDLGLDHDAVIAAAGILAKPVRMVG
jgi:hypothetical protein